jgi:hypothetical protein
MSARMLTHGGSVRGQHRDRRAKPCGTAMRQHADKRLRYTVIDSKFDLQVRPYSRVGRQ